MIIEEDTLGVSEQIAIKASTLQPTMRPMLCLTGPVGRRVASHDGKNAETIRPKSIAERLLSDSILNTR